MTASPKITFDAVKAVAAGRWPEILAGLGVEPSSLRNRHGPCPGCGGHDRFRFDDKEVGRFYCNGGGEPVSGDGFALLQHVHGWTAVEALQHVAGAVGVDSHRPAPMRVQRAPAKPAQPSWTTVYAQEVWPRASKDDAVVGSHRHAVRKGIGWAGGAGRATVSGSVVGRNADCLIAPIRTMAGDLIAIQAINAEGAKQTFGPMGDDGCLILGNTLDLTIPWAVVEGWADAVSFVFHIHKGNAVAACAFGKERMEKVAKALADHYHPHEIVIVEDAA